jgi:hypothetical protein
VIYATGLAFSVVGTVMWAWNDFGGWLIAALVGFVRAVPSELRSVLVRLHAIGPRATEKTGGFAARSRRFFPRATFSVTYHAGPGEGAI